MCLLGNLTFFIRYLIFAPFFENLSIDYLHLLPFIMQKIFKMNSKSLSIIFSMSLLINFSSLIKSLRFAAFLKIWWLTILWLLLFSLQINFQMSIKSWGLILREVLTCFNYRIWDLFDYRKPLSIYQIKFYKSSPQNHCFIT